MPFRLTFISALICMSSVVPWRGYYGTNVYPSRIRKKESTIAVLGKSSQDLLLAGVIRIREYLMKDNPY